MANLISYTARIDEEQIHYIKKISKLFNIDNSSAFRNILEKGIRLDRQEKALSLYMQGKFSIEQASNFAGMYIGEFYDYMRDRGVESNLTLDDFKDSLKNLKQ